MMKEYSPSGPPTPDGPALRRALIKLDAFLLPVITMIYFLSFLDRANIGNARPAGLQSDLGLSNTQYSIALTVTYVPYIAAELPLTLAMKAIGPQILIPVLAVCWGLVTTFQGFVHNYEGLLAARFFLGMTEGAILPASITYLSSFYCRADLGKRIAFFFSATSLAGAFSGLLAAALLNMEGLGGKRGWQWIFIIEGLFTVVWGALSLFLLPKDIHHARYFSEEQRSALLLAHEIERQHEEEHQPLTMRVVLSALKAPQMWLMFLQFFGSGTMLYALAYFAPSESRLRDRLLTSAIVQSIGYKGVQVQLYSVPPYACSAFFSLASCYASDRLRLRGPFVIISALISITGYAMYLGSTHTQVLYASLFLQVIGAYTLAPLQSTWMPNNLAPYYKRVTGITMGFISTNSGGILSTWLFPTTESPRFTRGTSILLGMASMTIIAAVANMLYLARENRQKSKAVDGGDDTQGEGDRNVKFKYIL